MFQYLSSSFLKHFSQVQLHVLDMKSHAPLSSVRKLSYSFYKPKDWWWYDHLLSNYVAAPLGTHKDLEA